MFELYVHISYLFDILRFDLAAGSCMCLEQKHCKDRTEEGKWKYYGEKEFELNVS